MGRVWVWCGCVSCEQMHSSLHTCQCCSSTIPVIFSFQFIIIDLSLWWYIHVTDLIDKRRHYNVYNLIYRMHQCQLLHKRSHTWTWWLMRRWDSIHLLQGMTCYTWYCIYVTVYVRTRHYWIADSAADCPSALSHKIWIRSPVRLPSYSAAFQRVHSIKRGV